MNIVRHGGAISACGKGAQREGVLGLLQEMSLQLLMPKLNVVSYNAAIRGCEKGVQ